MNEVRRQAYLEAMGIDSWFPRFVLPGAAPTRPCRWPEPLPRRASADTGAPLGAQAVSAAHADTGQPSRRRSQPPPAMPAEAMREARVPPRASPEARSPASTGRPSRPRLAGELDAPAATARNAGAAPAHQQTTPASEGPVRFRLAFLRCGPLAVLNQLPLLGSERLGGAQRRLFLNLMNALGLPAGQASIPEDSFRWPFAATLMDGGAEAARLALRAYVDERMGEEPVRALLVLGEQLAPFVLPDGAALEPGRLLRGEALPWDVVLSRSLDEVLSLPTLKRQLWRDLAALPALAPTSRV